MNALQTRTCGTSLSRVKHLCHLKTSSCFKKVSLMVVILSLIRNSIMPSVGIVLIFFCHVEVLGDELMAEGHQNEQSPWVAVKMNEGKRSTDLNLPDQRKHSVYLHMETLLALEGLLQNGLCPRWVSAGVTSLNVTVVGKAEEHQFCRHKDK